MNRFSLFLAFFFLGIAGIVLAQEIPMPMIPQMEPKQIAQTSAIIKPAMKAVFSKPRTGFFAMSFLMNPMLADGFKKEYGFTDEQVAEIKDFPKLMANLQENESLRQELKATFDGIPLPEGDLESFALTPEQEAKMIDGMNKLFDAIDTAVSVRCTDEQKAKLEEMGFIMFGGIDSPFMDLQHYDNLLDLTDEQKVKLREMEQELSGDREEIFDEIRAMSQKMLKDRKLNLKDTQKLNDKLQAFLLKRKPKIAEILTEEQLAKARGMMKNMPKFLTKFDPASFKQWIPGLDSWKPGDPVPERENEPKKERVFPGQNSTTP